MRIRALRDVLPALAPPALTGVGDKLHDEALVAAMTVSEPPRQTVAAGADAKISARQDDDRTRWRSI